MQLDIYMDIMTSLETVEKVSVCVIENKTAMCNELFVFCTQSTHAPQFILSTSI